MKNHFNGYVVCALDDNGEIDFDNKLYKTGSLLDAENKVEELTAQGIACDYVDMEVWA